MATAQYGGGWLTSIDWNSVLKETIAAQYDRVFLQLVEEARGWRQKGTVK